jgi:hypothetical protein
MGSHEKWGLTLRFPHEYSRRSVLRNRRFGLFAQHVSIRPGVGQAAQQFWIGDHARGQRHHRDLRAVGAVGRHQLPLEPACLRQLSNQSFAHTKRGHMHTRNGVTHTKRETGQRETGSRETGSRETGSCETGSHETGSHAKRGQVLQNSIPPIRFVHVPPPPHRTPWRPVSHHLPRRPARRHLSGR